MKTKAFIEALVNFNRNPDKTKKFLSDKRLTQIEKIILNGYFLLRSNKNLELISQIEFLSNSENDFIQSQRHLLLGLAFNNMGSFDLAKKEIKLSITKLNGIEPYFDFIALINLFIISLNQSDSREMKNYLDRLMKLELSDPLDVFGVFRCAFNYYAFIGDFSNVDVVQKKISSLDVTLTESTKTGFLVDQFIYFSKVEDFDSCYKILSELKNLRNFHHSQNYIVMKLMLDHYTKNTPIYFSETEFKDYPSLLYKLKLVRALEERNMNEAKNAWNQLRLISPLCYGEHFQYNGEKNLFSLCLNKYLQPSEEKLSVQSIPSQTGKIEGLYNILNSHSAPLSRDVLYEAIYSVQPELKEDYLRLSRLIVKVKEKYGVKIQYRKNCYQLIQEEKKKAS